MKNKHLAFFAVGALALWQPRVEGQTTIDLGSAAGFAVLAGSGITIAGAVDSTTISGDIGSSPNPAIVGSGNVVLNGTNQGGDAIAQQAQSDLATAFSDAAAQAPTTSFGPIFDLGGLTLSSGVYSDPSSFAVTGTLTLDAQDNPNAVWIFQAGSSLTLASGGQIALINGANAANVYWEVGSSASLGSGSALAGSVLAFTSITLTSGATVDGQLLAENGAVTLDDNFIALAGTIPEPANTSLLFAGFLGLAAGVVQRRRRRANARCT
jgi:hypothetical protein